MGAASNRQRTGPVPQGLVAGVANIQEPERFHNSHTGWRTYQARAPHRAWFWKIGDLSKGSKAGRRMISKLAGVRLFSAGGVHGAAVLFGLLWVPASAGGQNVAPPPDSGLVTRALANELKAAQDSSHPMRYLLRKSSP